MSASVKSQKPSRLEIWENATRVLEAMPEHERQHHWDMSVWGKQTTCGTIACAAGTCGLDPWFRARGFTLDFDVNGESDISDVADFFGFEGSKRIFFDSRRRSVETVLGEVREFTDELRKVEVLTRQFNVPAIGTELPEHGGICAGVRLGQDGEADYVLIVGPEYDGYRTWKAANDWAKSLSIVGHSDFVLPNRSDSAGLFDRVRSLFQSSWYWTSEQHAGISSYAWAQYFGNGLQGYYCKDYGCRARAVRRVPIQSFVHSVISK